MITIGALGNRRFKVEAVDDAPVFVHDQPAPRSAAAQAHIGLATLKAYLNPEDGGDRKAIVQLPSGAVRHVDASCLCSAAGIAAIRLHPGVHGAARSVAA